MNLDVLTVQIDQSPFDVDSEMAKFLSARQRSGAIVSFVGQVRDYSENENVKWLQLEHYPDFTERAIATIAEKAQNKWPIHGLKVIHRVGRILPTEPIVLVAAASDHRRAAFRAVDFVMDYLKSEAPFWKQEITEKGARWIEPRENDFEDIARWRNLDNI